MPAYIARGMPESTDILAVPTWDWDAIRTYHTKWVKYRAVENGVSLVRSTYNGLSTATDAYGRVLMYSDPANVGYERVVFAEIPKRKAFALYGKTNGIIDFVYPAGLIALFAAGIIGKRRKAHGSAGIEA